MRARVRAQTRIDTKVRGQQSQWAKITSGSTFGTPIDHGAGRLVRVGGMLMYVMTGAEAVDMVRHLRKPRAEAVDDALNLLE